MHLPPKKIIISHVYSSDNKGDAALTSVLIQDLKRKFGNPTITVLKLDATAESTYFEGIIEKRSFMSYALNKYRNPLIKLAYASYMMGATIAWASWRRTGRRSYLPVHLREVARLYENADLVVAVGGGYIRSRAGLVNRLNVPLLLHPLLFGYLLGKPTILYPQSVGPFQNRFEQSMVAFVLKRMTLILLREDTSKKLLASLHVTHNVERAIDSGFLLRSVEKLDIRKLYDTPAHKQLMGVTVRDWLKGEAQINYEKAVAAALDNLIETSLVHIVFIPQVTAAKGDDDRVVSRRVRNLMRHTEAVTLINDVPDHHRIKALYNNLDLLLGTRFHSVIFSLTSHVPVLAIEYEHKTSGIMSDLGLEDWVIKIEEVTAEKLKELLKKLVREQAEYRRFLDKHLPPYEQLALQSAGLLAESYAAANRKQSAKDDSVYKKLIS